MQGVLTDYAEGHPRYYEVDFVGSTERSNIPCIPVPVAQRELEPSQADLLVQYLQSGTGPMAIPPSPPPSLHTSTNVVATTATPADSKPMGAPPVRSELVLIAESLKQASCTRRAECSSAASRQQ